MRIWKSEKKRKRTIMSADETSIKYVNMSTTDRTRLEGGRRIDNYEAMLDESDDYCYEDDDEDKVKKKKSRQVVDDDASTLTIMKNEVYTRMRRNKIENNRKTEPSGDENKDEDDADDENDQDDDRLLNHHRDDRSSCITPDFKLIDRSEYSSSLDIKSCCSASCLSDNFQYSEDNEDEKTSERPDDDRDDYDEEEDSRKSTKRYEQSLDRKTTMKYDNRTNNLVDESSNSAKFDIDELENKTESFEYRENIVLHSDLKLDKYDNNDAGEEEEENREGNDPSSGGRYAAALARHTKILVDVTWRRGRVGDRVKRDYQRF